MIRKSIGLLVVLAVICASVAIVSAGDSFGPLALTESGLVVSWHSVRRAAGRPSALDTSEALWVLSRPGPPGDSSR
jgi:hypothetical protein